MIYVQDTCDLCPGDAKLLGHNTVSVARKRISVELRKWRQQLLIFVAAL